MQRRNFIKNTALCAVAVSASGFISFDGISYVGDCETTTDILGPFYRPGSPVRNNLVIKGDLGDLIELSGSIKHKDCVTPYKKARIELWHCSSKGVYDNESGEYRYHCTAFSGDNGNYSFKTILPVPYEIGSGQFRPAHFHIMITAEGYQPLVTQLYFVGDVYVTKDSSSSSPNAKRRILTVQTRKDGTKKVIYNVGMSDTLALEPTAIDKLTGVYSDEKDKTQTVELFASNNELWMKNEVYGQKFNYMGNNTFEWPEVEPGDKSTVYFEILNSGSVKATFTSLSKDGKKAILVSVKEK
jgi:catechol 1,2-dioxygenase